MSSIRLSGSTSGHYDLTVPAVAGTNSIDLSKLIVDNDDRLTLTSNATFAGLQISAAPYTDLELHDSTNNYAWIMSNRGTNPASFEIITRNSSNTYTQPLRIHNNGAVQTQYQPAFSAYLSSDVSGTGTTKLTWTKALQSNSLITNRDSGFDETNDRFTAPVAGLYFLGVHTDFSGNVSSNWYITIGINGSNRNYDLIESMNGSTNGSIGAYRVIPMQAGDYAEVYKHGGTWGLYGGQGGPQWRTHWNGFLIG